MTPDDWAHVEQLYHALRALPPEKRAPLLAGVSSEIRHEVEALLGAETGPAFLAGLGDSSTRTQEVSIGSELGPYRIEARLGEGGMGQVFRGLDTRLNRPVAVKVAHAEFNDWFMREARNISALNHPYICTLYDVGPNYLVMERWKATRWRRG